MDIGHRASELIWLSRAPSRDLSTRRPDTRGWLAVIRHRHVSIRLTPTPEQHSSVSPSNSQPAPSTRRARTIDHSAFYSILRAGSTSIHHLFAHGGFPTSRSNTRQRGSPVLHAPTILGPRSFSSSRKGVWLIIAG